MPSPMAAEGAGRRRSPRADAARNAGRIVEAAWHCFNEHGADTQLEEIARRAGVGTATLYRHFANKEVLVGAVLGWRFTVEVEPVIVRAQQDEDSWHAMVAVLEAALAMTAREHRVLLAAPRATRLTQDLAARFLDALTVTVRRAQADGLVRADLVPDDLPRLVLMLISVMRLAEQPVPEDWPRYLGLLLDALRPAAATPLLPPPSPFPGTLLQPH